MRNRILKLFLMVALLAGEAMAAEEVRFLSGDGIEIHGDIYRAESGPSAPLILLFHQAGGDARGEYGPMVQRLQDAGYHAMAIDQRVGGTRFGGVNRTAAGLADGVSYGYCEVYPDLEAALAHARTLGFSGKIAVWGSSYSAALVFQLAAKYPGEVSAVLAFSPASGGPLADCAPRFYSADLSLPVLALRPVGEMEVESVATQLERLRSEGHRVYVADPGVHGSSMLNAERVGASTEAAWSVVLDFLEQSLN